MHHASCARVSNPHYCLYPMSTSTRFCLSIALIDASMRTRPSAPPAELCLNLGLVPPTTSDQSMCTERPSDDPPETAETPATLTGRGSFNYDWERGNYLMEWSDLAAFNVWHQKEELCYSIELILSMVKCRGPLWTERWVYICSCQMSGGQKKYEKKNPGWHRKIDSKKTGCHCRVAIKLYPHTDTIFVTVLLLC